MRAGEQRSARSLWVVVEVEAAGRQGQLIRRRVARPGEDDALSSLRRRDGGLTTSRPSISSLLPSVIPNMPPKSTPVVEKKQTTLFGFFNKAPPSSSPLVRPASNGAGASSSASKPTAAAAAASSSTKPKTAAPSSSSKNVPASSSPLNRSSEIQPLRKKLNPLGALLPTPASSAASSTQNGALIDLSEDGEPEEPAAPTSDLPPSGTTDMDVDENHEDEHPVGRSVRATWPARADDARASLLAPTALS